MAGLAYIAKTEARRLTLERWKISVQDLSVRTLFKEFNIDVRHGSSNDRIVREVFRCLNIEFRRDQYRLQWGAAYLRISILDGGLIDCRKVHK